MANTKVTKAVLADDAVGLAQLDITNDPSDGQALTAVAVSDGYNLTWATVSGGVDGISSSADADAIFITSAEKIGLGATHDLGANVHIKTADSGVSAVNGNADDLVIENADYTGISILGENETSIFFGDNEDSDVGRIEYFHSTNSMTFRTNASDRLKINSNGNIGINTASADIESLGDNYKQLMISSSVDLYPAMVTYQTPSTTNTSAEVARIHYLNGTNRVGQFLVKPDGAANNSAYMAWFTMNAGTLSERMRITSSGNVGIGTTSPSVELHVYSSNQDALKVETGTGVNQIELKNNSGSPTYITQSDFGLQLKCDENGFGGTASFFSVKVKASERMRIFSDGKMLIRPFSGTTQTTDGGQLQMTSANDLYSMYVSNTGFASVGSIKACERSATSAYSFAQWYSGRRPDNGGGDREFNFRGDGNAYADGSFNNSGADYAEYFESHTGSAIPRGTSVVLENNKVRAATSEDDVADIIGVVRPKEFGKNSMVVGNTAWNMWSEKYLTDDFNCYVMEDYSVVSWYEYRDEDDDEGTLVTYESDNIPSDVTVPDDAETNTHDENGVKFQRRTLNPDFDDSLTYESREDRDEWVIVGLIGQVQILDGQPTNDRWIKMRDISDTVEEWYIR